ncbi:hypothetical protein LV779_13950 [Streptomyces thinghirensis]|nr:hypothetical protein [Streptomyces thinghirensis]
MTGLYEIWQRAEVSRRLDVLSGFIAVCVAGEGRRAAPSRPAGCRRGRCSLRLAPGFGGRLEYLDELVCRADAEWTDHP